MVTASSARCRGECVGCVDDTSWRPRREVPGRVLDARLRRWRPKAAAEVLLGSSLPVRLERYPSSGLLPRAVVLALSMLLSNRVREAFRPVSRRLRGEVAGLLVQVLVVLWVVHVE